MDYKQHYDRLISRAKTRLLEGYTERHHIIPRCMEGTDDDNNIVNLTAEEHYVAHQLLVKIFPSNYSLIYALNLMSGNGLQRNNKSYGWIKRKMGKAQSKRVYKWQEEGISIFSDEARAKRIESLTGQVRSKKHCRNISKAKKGMIFTDEHKRKLSEARKGTTPINKGERGIYAWFNNEIEEQFLKIVDAPANWHRGRIKKKVAHNGQ